METSWDNHLLAAQMFHILLKEASFLGILENSLIIYSSEIETQCGREDACLCFLASLGSQEEREHGPLSVQKVFL